MPTTDPTARPDPDELLRKLQKEEAAAKRGKLKVFFGFAPGVGKTYRMLRVAHDLASQHGVDVVVGLVEHHRRRETEQMVGGLEQLPRRKVEYRGRTVEEFDLDAALARRPGILLLDELAHTNVPGARHPKRWQDVEELLDAGIHVFTTVNVQHVESLNDVVAQITGVQVRETVPDSIIDGASEIELVDIPPDELLARLKEGKIYVAAQATRAAQHFFQKGNLLALRELALRRTAQHVDDDVRAYRTENGVDSTWPVAERILVCVGPAPSSGRLVRAAARMAAGLRCPWVASYVDVLTASPMSQASRDSLEQHLRVAEALGGSVVRLSGVDVADTLLEYAKKNNVTRLIIGKPTHSTWRDRLRGSLLDSVVRGSGDVDVHVISGDDTTTFPQSEGPRVGDAQSGDYIAASALAGLTLAVALIIRRFFHLPDLEMLFLLNVMLTAARFGRGPSLVAAALGVASYDFFFVPPFYTFSVDDRSYFLTFAMMFGVGYAMSELTGRLRRQEQRALAREERTSALYALTKEMASTERESELASVATRHASAAFAAQAVVLCPTEQGLAPLAATPDEAVLEAKEMGVAKWSFEHGAVAGFGTETLPGAASIASPLFAGGMMHGVLVLVPRTRATLTAEQKGLLDLFCRQLAGALRRSRLSKEAEAASLRANAEEMRSSLLSAVSHDLRTPLAAIIGSATSLRGEPDINSDVRRDLLDSVVSQAERMERLISNLLDMTRVESGAISLRRDWVPLEEMVGSALTRLEAILGERPIRVAIAPDLPFLWVDPVLFEQVFVNLLENAEKHTPKGSQVDIRASFGDGTIAIEVEDNGAGFPAEESERLFEKFYRRSPHAASGAGLGLAICKGIVEAHGGSIEASSVAGKGALFRIKLPTKGNPEFVPPTEGAE